MTNKEVVRLWVNQLRYSSDARKIFHRGKTLYSYTDSYPIAYLVDDSTVLVTYQSYSASTTNHINLALEACKHLNVIRCKSMLDIVNPYTTKEEKHLANLKDWEKIYEGTKKHSPLSRAKYLSEIIKDAVPYVKLFSIDEPVFLRNAIEEYNSFTSYIDKVKK